MIKYKFCPQCKSNLVDVGDKFACPSCGTEIFMHSKPYVSILPVREEKVLLAVSNVESSAAHLEVIGGLLKHGEHPEAGALRIAWEETGLEVRVVDMLGMYIDELTQPDDFSLNIQYIVQVAGGKMRPRGKMVDLFWVPIQDITLKEGLQNTREALADLQEWHLIKRLSK